MQKFIVIGNPIEHSKSPIVHQLFAKQFDLDICYEKMKSPLDGFQETVQQFIESGGVGANVTVPFKEQAATICDQLSEAAQIAGAVNTLYFYDNKIYGDNTDGIGLVRDITDNHRVSLQDKTILLIGAGGASKGVLLPILKENPSKIIITNRTEKRAVQLAEQFNSYQSVLEVRSFADLKQEKTSYDVIINATSASLTDEGLGLDDNIFIKTVFVYDMMYQKKLSSFLQQAKDKKIPVADGLGMLVEQAAESFSIWLKLKPNTKEVIACLRDNHL